MSGRVLLQALQAIYTAEIEVSILSQWDAGWMVELANDKGTRRRRQFDDGQLEHMAEWLCACADDLAPGWRTAALR